MIDYIIRDILFCSASQSDLLGLIQICIITFSDRPPVFASRTPQPPAPQQPPVQQFGYGGGPQPPPYPPTAGSTPYPPVPPTNTPYPPGGTAAYPPYATPNVGSTPYPPAYPPAASTGYPPYPQGANQTTRVEENNSGTITSEHIKVNILQQPKIPNNGTILKILCINSARYFFHHF